MKNFKNCHKYLLILAVLFSVAAHAQTRAITQKSGKIYVTDGAGKKLVAGAQYNTQPLAAGDHVYYISNVPGSKMTINAYSIADNTTTDIVKADALNSGMPTDKKITNMIFDNTANRLYFSTVSVNAQGYEDYLTWYYNPANNEIKMYADGKITGIDANGLVESEMHNADAKGRYVQKHVNNTDGTPHTMGARTYTHQVN